MQKPEGFDQTKYHDYLCSSDWQAIAEKVKKRDGNRCVVCGATLDLQAHHLTYSHVYEEEDHLEDLVTLCGSHHRGYHIVDELTAKAQARTDFERYEQQKDIWRWLKEKGAQVEKDIEEAYLKRDYSADGDLDMCNYQVIDKAISSWCQSMGLKDDILPYIGRQRIHDFFMMRRYEFLLRCMDQKRSIEEISRRSKFTRLWIVKNYKRKFLEAKLQEEKFVSGKEEQ